jgi:tetratricopeptide (TPR) repeat protein
MDDTLDIKTIHPELEPVRSTPSLFSFYGCGFRLLGDRDYSEQTKSSVKTLYFTLFYIPIIPLKAYRVIKDRSQYFFLGQSPVSGFAQKASMAFVSIAALGITGFGTQQYLTSDGYVNGKIMKSAEAAMDQGALGEAMQHYKKAYINSDKYKRDARLGIADLMSLKTLKNASSSDMAQILKTYSDFNIPPLSNTPEGVYELSIQRIENGDKSDTVGTHKLLHATQAFNPDGKDLSDLDYNLVSALYENNSDDIDIAIEMAEFSFNQQNFETAKAILIPFKDSLSDTEGARILGQLYVAEGNNKEAYPLLSTYTSERLKKMQSAEEEFLSLQTLMWDAEFNILRDGNGPDSFYNAYNAKTSEVEQQLFVDEYITDKLQKNETYLMSLEAYRESAAIVPIVMDFGILQLRAAETMTSEADRQAELEAAENTFLSIKNIAGDTDDYKLYLGQVYFWLGKQDEGQALFDDILTSNNRSSDSLLAVATTLRTLGKIGQATELSKEAYNTASYDEARYNAANFLQLISNTIEEKISWLEKSDPESAYTQASLFEYQGHLAEQKTQYREAAKLYRKAIERRESLPSDASNYNNTALSYFSLHRVTNDKSAYKKGVELMSKAVELRPDESILISNAATSLLTNSLYETIDGALDYQTVQLQPSFSNIGYHYSNDQEKETLRAKVGPHADLQKAIEYFKRSILLSPNNSQNYNELYSIYYFLDDRKAIADLASKAADNQIDFSADQKSYLDYLEGTNDEKSLNNLKAREAFFRKKLSQGAMSPVTKSALQNELSENLLAQVVYGNTMAAAEATRYARAAHKNNASSNIKTQLITCLLTQASIEAAEMDKDYSSLRRETVKSISDPKLVTLVLNTNQKASNWLRSNELVKQAVKLKIEQYEAFPNTPTADDWALFKTTSPDYAARVINEIKTSDFVPALQSIRETLSPYHPNTTINRYWLDQISGRSTTIKSDLIKFSESGIEIPENLFQ